MAKRKQVRDRIITIDRIYDKPKLLAEKENYNFYSFGVKLVEGGYANVNASDKTEEEAMKKIEPTLIVDQKTNERIQEGQKYKIFEESTDAQGKYWEVVSFIKLTDTPESADPNLPDSDDALAKQEMEVETSGVGATQTTSKQTTLTPYERTQIQIVRQSTLNYATQLASAYLAWEMKENPDKIVTLEDMTKRIKAIAKEFEEQVLRK